MNANERIAKLERLRQQGQQTAGMSADSSGRMSRLSVSLPRDEAARVGEFARGIARATGDKPSISQLVRAALELFARASDAERASVLGALAKTR